jgi:hypothetical protein
MAATGAVVATADNPTIPKIVHQIWLGTNPRPDSWIATVKDFCKANGYRYMLWTELNMDQLGFNAIPGLSVTYKRQKSMAGRADIIRLLALYKYGGIYIDADSVIMKPEKFHHFLEENNAAVFFGWEEVSLKRAHKIGRVEGLGLVRRLVANGLIGARKQHAFILTLLERIVENVRSNAGEDAWKQVGPLFVTQVYTELKDYFPDVHIYPMKYFYPMHWGGITDPELHTKIKIPAESMLFQYGYTTNHFEKIFANV